jgi:hypothetical protein
MPSRQKYWRSVGQRGSYRLPWKKNGPTVALARRREATSMSAHDEVLTAIGGLYEAAVAPDLWPTALDRVGDLFGQTSLLLTAFDMRDNVLGRSFTSRIDPHSLDLFHREYNTPATNPHLGRNHLAPVGQPILARELCDNDAFPEVRRVRRLLSSRGPLGRGQYHPHKDGYLDDGGSADAAGAQWTVRQRSCAPDPGPHSALSTCRSGQRPC